MSSAIMRNKPPEEFVTQVGDAYTHLYDLAYLRTHALGDMLLPELSSARERAWRLHHLLLQVIEDLRPSPQAPIASREWRRHRLMVLRYVDGLDAPLVSEQLGLSRRHFYREHGQALQVVAALLWQQALATSTPVYDSSSAPDSAVHTSLDLLREETIRLGQSDACTRLEEVLHGVLPLMDNLLLQRDVALEVALPAELPTVDIEQGLLRQLLLGALEYMIKFVAVKKVSCGIKEEDGLLSVVVRAEPVQVLDGPTASEAEARLAALVALTSAGQKQITFLPGGPHVAVLELTLPLAEHWILLVDDNADALELFRRYMTGTGYRVATASSGQEALELARQLRPYAILLDLMMPGVDGWDVLQSLRTDTKTADIPILVCTVLKQKDLAFSLGATAFLEKPISEQALLQALESLAPGRCWQRATR